MASAIAWLLVIVLEEGGAPLVAVNCSAGRSASTSHNFMGSSVVDSPYRIQHLDPTVSLLRTNRLPLGIEPCDIENKFVWPNLGRWDRNYSCHISLLFHFPFL